MHITKWNSIIWNSCTLHDFNYTTFWKRQNYEDHKKISSCLGTVERVKQKIRLGKWTYFLWYYNNVYMALYFFQTYKIYDTKNEVSNMEFKWLWSIKIYSSFLKKMLRFWWLTPIIGEGMYLWRKGVCEKSSLLLPFNFIINLNFYKK